MQRRHGRLPHGRLGTLLGAVTLGAALLTGCASNSAVAVAQHGAIAADTGASPAAASITPVPAPNISITPKDGAADVALDQAVQVAIDTGQLDSVVVHTDGDNTPLPGQLGPHNRSWQSAGPLDPKVHYVVQATAHDSGGTSTAQAAFKTLAVRDRLTTNFYPEDGSTVGIGMPIILRFNNPVASDKQAGVVANIQVQTSTPVLGAWHWFSESEVHWRPKDYWPSGTTVKVNANLRGVNAGNDIWGLGDWNASFTIGEKHYSEIDAAAHEMKVYKNDQLVYTYPVSTGVDNHWPTLSGTLFVWYKLQKVHMTSDSIGIPKNAPGGYDEDVFWDTAISTDGFFIHSAPWSVWAQGSRNVSHGCVNLSESRAVQFFNFSQQGDVVVVKNTNRVADSSDGEADWQVPWDQFANSGGQVPATTPQAPANTGGL
jgi:lipoprotein-anchoring transpeptidase ErfK/SrfK